MSRLLAPLAAFALAAAAHATSVVYDNSVHFDDVFLTMDPIAERGDSITLGGTERAAKTLEFWIWSNNNTGSWTSVRLRIYEGGANGVPPGRLLFDNTKTNVPYTYGPNLLTWSLGYIILPETVTWTLFKTGSGSAGPRRANPILTGSSDPYYWARNDGAQSWQQSPTNPTYNFGARLIATQANFVPPSNFAVTSGMAFGGNLQSVQLSDDQRANILNEAGIETGEFEFTATLPFPATAWLRFEFEGRATRTDLSQTIEVYNYLQQFWSNTVSNATLQDSVATIDLWNPSLASAHTSPTLEVKARARWIPQADIDGIDGWVQSCDMARWTLIQ